MRHLLCALGLATFASAARAQQAVPGAAAPPVERSVPPECTATGALRPAAASGDSLCVTRAGAIAAALAANPQIQVAGAVAQQARAARVQGVAMPDPVGTAEWDGSRLPFGVNGLSSKVFGASITIPFFDKFRLNGRIGTEGIRQSEADSVTVREAIVSQTSQTYDSLLQALRHRSDLHEADSLATDFLRKTQTRFDAGTVARLDVVNARVAVAQAENDLISNERYIATARSALNRLLGRPLGAPLTTADSLIIPGPLPALADLEAAAMRNRPELASLNHQQQGAHAATALSREFWLPDVTFGISKDFLADPTPGYLTTGLSFPIPIFYWNHAKGEIAQAKFYEDQLAAAARDLQAAVGQDVRVSFATAATALRQAIYIRDELLPASRQAYEIAAASYGLGGLSALDVNAARLALISAEDQYTDALAAASSARADLERAAATPLATLGTGATP